MDHPEHKESLWFMIISPILWAAHFLLCYVSAAIWCAKSVSRVGTLGPVRWAILTYTLIALFGIGWNGRWAWNRYALGSSTSSLASDTRGGRHRFLGLATTLLAGLSAIATVFSAIAVSFFTTCE